ncbi:MAG: acyl-CoA dehydrogenase family protein [Candidatus Omnitrophica bacterium]|nr:acyl-CoA dehydrogenase family protein [Candidatus Omnitrophota bacterium]
MANFFKDNPDIVFNFETMDLAEIARWQEDNFADKGKFDYAPQDEKDAIDNYRRVLEIVGEIAAEYIAPRGEAVDIEGNTLKDCRVTYNKAVKENLAQLSRSDLMGFTLPRRFEGLNMPNLVYTMAVEIVSRADASLMNLFGLQGIAETINAFASEEIKAKYLPPFSRGEVTGAMALTEPDAGSDLQKVQLKAFQDDKGEWRLRGVKRFITNGCGEILLVLARSEENEQGGLGLSLFLCERSKHVIVRHLENKLGIHGSPTCELQFNDAPCLLIGERRRGLITYVMALMNGARIGIAGQSLGIAQAAFEKAREYAHSREQFGVSINRLPAVSELLSEMCVSIEAARALTYETSRVVDILIGMMRKSESAAGDKEAALSFAKDAKQLSRLASLLTPMSKYYSSEMCNQVASSALQVLGGSGYMKDYPVERYFRDARITNIYEGTSQLQVVAAIKGVTSGVAEKRYLELEAGLSKLSKDFDWMEPMLACLKETRRILAEAVNFAKSKAGGYLDLYARDIVDIAIDIFIGYFFLKQATRSERKLSIAKRFISKMIVRSKMKRDLILSGEESSIQAFDEIVGTGVTS